MDAAVDIVTRLPGTSSREVAQQLGRGGVDGRAVYSVLDHARRAGRVERYRPDGTGPWLWKAAAR